MIELTAYRGDSMSFTIPLTNGTAAFTPGGSYSLIFTAKRSSKDPDTAAVFQKSTATGTITTSTTNAIVTVLYTDTTTEDEPVLYWDIQAQHNSTAAVITAAKGTLTLVRDITRQTTASVPIYTIDPAAGGGGATPAGSTGSVQINNSGALAADSGLVYTGTGDLGTLKVGGGRIYMDATTGAIQANNVAIGGSNGVMPFANVTPAAGNVGSLNVSIGAGNFQDITTGARNVACGSYSLTNVITGSSNLAIGNNTLFDLESGQRNVALGSGAGGGITSGNDNIMIASAPANGTVDCQIAIAGTPDGASSTVIGYDGKNNEVPTTKTRFIGNTIIWGDGVVGGNSPTASPNNRTSLVQTSSGSAKTITLPNVTGKLPVYTDTPVAGRVLTATDASGAATWEVAAGGAPTNAQVNTAISTNPLASRIAMSASEQNINLKGLKNTIELKNSNAIIPVSAILLGDSFAATGSLFNFSYITRVVGSYKTGALTGGGDSGVTTVNDYTKSPSGSYLSVAAGGNLTCGHLQTGQQGGASQAYYTFFTGTGTAQLQYKKGAGAFTNFGSPIDTSLITNVQIGTIALPDASSNYAVRVTATGGTVNGWIGQGMSGPGLTTMDFATSGQQIEQSATVTETIWKAMIAGYKVAGGAQIVLTAFADDRFINVPTSAWPTKGVSRWNSTGPAQTLYTWSVTQNSEIDWVVIGPHQVDTTLTVAADATVDAAFTAIGIGSSTNDRTVDGARAQREFAVYNQTAWCDSIDITNYINGNAQGLYGDQIHFNTKGQNYKRSHLFNQTNLGYAIGASNEYTALHIGSIKLSSTAVRSASPSLIAYLTALNENSLVPITASNFRAGDAINPEQSGMEFAWVSTNLARIRAYSSSGANGNAVEITYNGAGISLRPSSVASSQNGSSSLPWETTFTQGLVLPPVAQTATTAAVSTVYVTTALTTTAPLQGITLANGVAGQIKIITHVATSGGGTAELIPATKTGYAKITFTSVGDTVTLQYYATGTPTVGWIISSIRGAVAA